MRVDPEQVEHVLKIMRGELPRYKLVGECTRCGACCEAEDCEHFSRDVNGVAGCAIFGQPGREEKCTDYPYNPPVIFKTCGYRFVDTLEGDRVLDVHKV